MLGEENSQETAQVLDKIFLARTHGTLLLFIVSYSSLKLSLGLNHALESKELISDT